jgi:hypothetical protein
MKHILLIISLLTPNALFAGSNDVMRSCFQQADGNWTDAAACHSLYRSIERDKEDVALRAFLKANPRYMYPGQSLNKCFGKPREFAFESVEQTGTKFIARYKEFIKPCKETS